MFSSSSDELYMEWCGLKPSAKILAYPFRLLPWDEEQVRGLTPNFPLKQSSVDRRFMPYIKDDHHIHSQAKP